MGSKKKVAKVKPAKKPVKKKVVKKVAVKKAPTNRDGYCADCWIHHVIFNLVLSDERRDRDLGWTLQKTIEDFNSTHSPSPLRCGHC